VNFFKNILAVVSSGVIDNVQSGGGAPSNSYTQTTSGETFTLLISIALIIGLIFVFIIGYFIYSVINDPTKPKKNKTQNIKPLENKEPQNLYEKIYQLDQADLSKAEGFIEALLTADKYKKSKEQSQESD
jgi:predicted permease